MNTIKRLIDINILNDLINKKKKSEKDKNQSNDNILFDKNNLDYFFAETIFEKSRRSAIESALFAESAFAISKLMKSSHSLLRSVIYDSKCSQSLIFDKNRFIDEIISSNDLIKISDEHMQIREYKIMLIRIRLRNKDVKLVFEKTTFIFSAIVTLISQTKLEKKKFDRDYRIKILVNTKTNKQVCEIQKRFEVQLLEYIFISKDDQREMINSIQLSKNIMIKAIS
jgi:hypothetical protein